MLVIFSTESLPTHSTQQVSMPRPMTDMIEVTRINDDDGHLPEKQAMQAQAMEHQKVT